MTRKVTTIIFTSLLLIVVPLATVEVPHDASAQQASVLGSKTLALASTTVKEVSPKPVVTKKPVAKKPVAKKKAPVKKKERLITAPPLITVETAPHSGKR